MSSNTSVDAIEPMDSCDNRPHCIVACLDANGEVVLEKYIQYLHFLSDFGRTLPLPPAPDMEGLTDVLYHQESELEERERFANITNAGLVQVITPVMSNWYLLYISRAAAC